MDDSTQLGFTERYSLEGVVTGWTADHYVEYLLMTADDAIDLNNVRDNLTDAESIEAMKQQIKRRVVGGKVLTLTGETIDLLPDHIDKFPITLLSDLFAAMNGVVDPKDSEPTNNSQSSTTQA